MTVQDITLPGMMIVKDRGNSATYTIEPLEAGYGYTLAPTLKQALISSLPGVAVTALRMNGVSIDAQTIPGVREDVTDIMLNIRQIRFRPLSLLTGQTVILHLRAAGAQDLTAAKIVIPAGTVEVANPDLPLATLETETASLDLELLVGVGKGYVPREEMNGAPPKGFTTVDAMFSPIQRVTYSVEHTRVGQMTNFDKIVLTIITDGTILPDDALSQVTQGVVDILAPITRYRLDLSLEERESQHLSSLQIPSNIYDLPIEDLELSPHAYHTLKRYGVRTAGHILVMSKEQLLEIPRFGDRSLVDVYEGLLAHGCFPVPLSAS